MTKLARASERQQVCLRLIAFDCVLLRRIAPDCVGLRLIAFDCVGLRLITSDCVGAAAGLLVATDSLL